MTRAVRTLAVPLLLAAAGFTIAVAQDAPQGPAPGPPAPKDGSGAAPAPPAFTPPAILAQRRKGLAALTANGAVAAGLDWLRRHQGSKAHPDQDGRCRWDCDDFPSVCQGKACNGWGESVFDPAVTALATLAFLGAGATHVEGPDAVRVGGALKYLVDIQDSEGCIGPRISEKYLYNHLLATMTIAEALWLTGDERLLGPVSRARDFIYASRNPYLAWRYGVRDGDNDSSLTSYAVLALRSCEFARLDVDKATWAGAQGWFDKMSDRDSGRVGYQLRGGQDARALGIGGGRSEARVSSTSRTVGAAQEQVLVLYPDTDYSALTAAAGASMALAGGAESAALVDGWAAFISRKPPHASSAGYLDLHYMVFGSLFHAQRPLDGRPKTEEERKDWRPWRDAVVADLASAQHKSKDGCVGGSWDPDADPFGAAGGRVYSTAMAVLALQAPNRFPKVWDPKAKRSPPEKK